MCKETVTKGGMNTIAKETPPSIAAGRTRRPCNNYYRYQDTNTVFHSLEVFLNTPTHQSTNELHDCVQEFNINAHLYSTSVEAFHIFI